MAGGWWCWCWWLVAVWWWWFSCWCCWWLSALDKLRHRTPRTSALDLGVPHDLRAIGQPHEVLELDGFISEHLGNLLVQVGLHISMHRVWCLIPVMADEVRDDDEVRRRSAAMMMCESLWLSWPLGRCGRCVLLTVVARGLCGCLLFVNCPKLRGEGRRGGRGSDCSPRPSDGRRGKPSAVGSLFGRASPPKKVA